jgi:GT2 family glycosyltransferase
MPSVLKRTQSPRAARAAARNKVVSPVSVSINDGTISLMMRGAVVLPAGTFDVLFDGESGGQLVIPDPAHTVTVPLPPHTLPVWLDLIDNATGRSAFSAPLSLEEVLKLRIERTSIDDGAVTVEVTLAGEPVAQLAVMLLAEPERVFAYGFARRTASEPGGRSRYVCTLPLLALLPIDGALPLSVFVSGRRLERPLSGQAQAAGIAGYVDHASSEGISGWAADLRDFERRLTIDVIGGDRRIGSVEACLPRPDLAAIGVVAPCGFTIPKAMFKDLRNGDSLSLLIAGTPTHLIHSPLTLSVETHIRGLFDNIDGNQACGWVIDLARPAAPCTVEALCEGRVIGTAIATGLRRDVLEAGLPTDRCGFRITFDASLQTLFDRDISVRIKGTNILLNGGPQQPKLNPNIRRYLAPDRGIAPAVLRRLRARINRGAQGLGVSLVMPVYNTRHDWLVEALRSVCTQWCDAWELICVDDASPQPHVARVLAWFAQMDSRIRVIHLPRNLGIAGATTQGMAAARYPYLALMDHDDVLEPDAIHHLIATARKTDADLIYSDEALTGEDSSVVLDVRARPAFSYDYYLSHPYFVHLVAVRTEIAQRIGGFDASLTISADVDFILRVIEQSRSVAHIPRVLYRWRTHEASAGHERQGQVMEATTRVIQRHLDRVSPGARARAAPEFNQFEVMRPDPGGRVLIIVPTKDGIDVLRQCIESIEATTPAGEYQLVVIDHESKEPKSRKYLASLAKRHIVMPYSGIFNYALMNNQAVRAHRSGEPFLLFMNNDIEAAEPGWLQRMRSMAGRRDVGAVGTALMYKDRRVQHGGVIVGINGLADHALRFETVWDGDGKRTLGYNASLTSVRDFSAVTAACMMMRIEVFDEVDGFNESFAVGFNDTDLCLRLGRSGYKILYDGRTVLFHHESVTRIAKAELKHPKDDETLRTDWGHLLKAGDPYYSPLLELNGRDHRLRLEPCGPAAARLVQVVLAGHRPRPVKPVVVEPQSARIPAAKPRRAKGRSAVRIAVPLS